MTSNMNCLLSRTPVGIRFGDCVFSDPAPLAQFSLPPRSAGLYVILMPDTTWGPWQLQPLFFGEFGPEREVRMSQAQQTCCLRVAAGRGLYFALYAVPHQHRWALSEIQRELTARYGPIANLESAGNSSEHAHRLGSIEKKMIEQDAVLTLILASLFQTVQLQQPEPKKRIIGFQPDPAGSRGSSTAARKPY